MQNANIVGVLVRNCILVFPIRTFCLFSKCDIDQIIKEVIRFDVAIFVKYDYELYL